MKNVLPALWHLLEPTKGYATEAKQLETLRRVLSAELEPEQRKRLLQLTDQYDELCDRQSYRNFVAGLRFGVHLMVQLDRGI